MLGDDTLKVSIDYSSEERPPFADDNVGDPTSTRSPNCSKPVLAPLERRRPQISAVSKQQVAGHISRAAASEQQLVEERPPGVIEHG
jgi:hypothetical protein